MAFRQCLRALSPIRKMPSPPKGTSYHTSSALTSPVESRGPANKKSSSASSPATNAKKEYPVGETFYNFDGYSFYDLELDMERHRLEQPSSEKAKPTFTK